MSLQASMEDIAAGLRKALKRTAHGMLQCAQYAHTKRASDSSKSSCRYSCFKLAHLTYFLLTDAEFDNNNLQPTTNRGFKDLPMAQNIQVGRLAQSLVLPTEVGLLCKKMRATVKTTNALALQHTDSAPLYI